MCKPKPGIYKVKVPNSKSGNPVVNVSGAVKVSCHLSKPLPRHQKQIRQRSGAAVVVIPDLLHPAKMSRSGIVHGPRLPPVDDIPDLIAAGLLFLCIQKGICYLLPLPDLNFLSAKQL